MRPNLGPRRPPRPSLRRGRYAFWGAATLFLCGVVILVFGDWLPGEALDRTQPKVVQPTRGLGVVAAILSAVPLGLWVVVSALSRDESENTAELLFVRFGRVALVSNSMLAAAGAGLLVFIGSLGAYFEGMGTPPELRAHFFFTKAGVLFCLMPGVSLSAIWAFERLLRLPSSLGKHRWLKQAFEDLA